MRRPFAAALFAVLLTQTSGYAASPDAPAVAHRVYLIGALRLSHPHFRLEDGGDGPVAVIEIQNRGSAPDRLLGATVDGAGATTLVGGEADGSLPIAPRATVALDPAGPHFTTSGWVNPGASDGRLGATLRFARAGEIRVSLRRETVAEPEPAPVAAMPEKAIDLAR